VLIFQFVCDEGFNMPSGAENVFLGTNYSGARLYLSSTSIWLVCSELIRLYP